MPLVKKYICSAFPTKHIYDFPSEDGYCPMRGEGCDYGHGILFEEMIDPDKYSTRPEPPIMVDDNGKTIWRPEPFPYHPGMKTPGNYPPGYEKEIGLCVLLMDASSSMTHQAFKGNPLTRMHLIASSAATGIFDLKRMHNNPNAYVAAFKFDDRVERMFVKTVAELIDEYHGDPRAFADDIYQHLFAMQQGTDINMALGTAHTFVSKFLQKDLVDFQDKNYTPMQQRIMLGDSIDSVAIPNVRVLIYTDGVQCDAKGAGKLLPNPFKSHKLRGLGHDIVIGAFFGNRKDEGYEDLKGLMSECPIHGETQFFYFDSPEKLMNLKYLFRMASGASGFCPKCLEKQMWR
jgi:hypothetical protein